jgi:hypothetical protein
MARLRAPWEAAMRLIREEGRGSEGGEGSGWGRHGGGLLGALGAARCRLLVVWSLLLLAIREEIVKPGNVRRDNFWSRSKNYFCTRKE